MIEISTTTCSHFNPIEVTKNDFEFASTTCIQRITQTTATSNTIGGFTYGEIMISFFLFLIVLGCLVGFIINRFLGIKIKRISI